MGTDKVSVRPPNSVILIGDPAGEVPGSMADGLVSSTSSCVAIGTLADADGETTIHLVDGAAATGLPSQMVFQGEVATPSKCLRIASVLGQAYLERAVDASSVRLKILVNDDQEPDQIFVVVDDR